MILWSAMWAGFSQAVLLVLVGFPQASSVCWWVGWWRDDLRWPQLCLAVARLLAGLAGYWHLCFPFSSQAVFQEHNRANPNSKAVFKPLFVLCLLLSHWPNQITRSLQIQWVSKDPTCDERQLQRIVAIFFPPQSTICLRTLVLANIFC